MLMDWDPHRWSLPSPTHAGQGLRGLGWPKARSAPCKSLLGLPSSKVAELPGPIASAAGAGTRRSEPDSPAGALLIRRSVLSPCGPCQGRACPGAPPPSSPAPDSPCQGLRSPTLPLGRASHEVLAEPPGSAGAAWRGAGPARMRPACRLHPQGQAAGRCAPRARLDPGPPLRRAQLAAGRRLRPCRAGSKEDSPDHHHSSGSGSGSGTGLLGRAVRWTAELVRSGLDRQAATAQRWRQGHFSSQVDGRDKREEGGQDAAAAGAPAAEAAAGPAFSAAAAAVSLASAPAAGQEQRTVSSSAAEEEADAGESHFGLLPEQVPPPELDAPFSEWEEVRPAPAPCPGALPSPPRC